MKNIVRNRKATIILTLAGAAGGYLYWRFVGCNSGTCAIRSVWYWSTLWGAAVGYLAGDLISDILQRLKKRREDKSE